MKTRWLLNTYPRLRNDLYCVEWDVKLYYTIPFLNTRQPTANPSPAFLVVATCDRAARGHLDFPRVKLVSYGGRSFAHAGPSHWNSLPAHLRDS